MDPLWQHIVHHRAACCPVIAYLQGLQRLVATDLSKKPVKYTMKFSGRLGLQTFNVMLVIGIVLYIYTHIHILQHISRDSGDNSRVFTPLITATRCDMLRPKHHQPGCSSSTQT